MSFGRFFLILGIVLAPAVYFSVIYSKGKVIDELVEAAQNNDVQAMSMRVDWEGLRSFLKDDLSSRKKALGTQAASIGPALSQIPRVVDYYVLSENIRIAYYYHDLLFPDVPEEDFIWSSGFAPPLGFYVTLGYPKSVPRSGDATDYLKDRLRVKFVFRLDGLTWKIRQAHVPLFMVPRRTHDAPAVRIFGPP